MGGEGEEEEEEIRSRKRLVRLQNFMGNIGALKICANIVAVVNDSSLVEEALKLAYWLVKYGNDAIQTRFIK
jgi:hypothetical protein